MGAKDCSNPLETAILYVVHRAITVSSLAKIVSSQLARKKLGLTLTSKRLKTLGFSQNGLDFLCERSVTVGVPIRDAWPSLGSSPRPAAGQCGASVVAAPCAVVTDEKDPRCRTPIQRRRPKAARPPKAEQETRGAQGRHRSHRARWLQTGGRPCSIE